MKASITTFLIIMTLTLSGQNLIPNPSFELYSNCVGDDYLVENLMSWQNPTLGTPDYFRVCSGLVPDNYATHQIARTGDSYLGMVIKNFDNTIEWREYVQCELISPLEIGKKYKLTMYANLSNYYSQYGSSSIGGFFTTYPYFQNDFNYIYQQPQIVNDSSNYITDTLGWQLIQIPFIADSNYTHLTIGNFSSDALTNIVYVQEAPIPTSYFLLDDISLVADTITDISYVSQLESLKIYPNPFNQLLYIHSELNEELKMTIFDITGRIVIQKNFLNSNSIDTSPFSKGIYFYEIQRRNGICIKGKVIKQ